MKHIKWPEIPKDAEGWREIARQRMSDEALHADIAAGGYGIHTHPRTAAALLRLDTVERRIRADNEAYTLSNLMGGIHSSRVHEAASSILDMIARGREEDELYGERTAREYREREQALREVVPGAIYMPREFRR